MCLRAARTLATDDDIRIIYARHGLLALTTTIAPYDTKLSASTAITAEQLHDQPLQLASCTGTSSCSVEPSTRGWCARVWPGAEAPLLGSRGIGEHRQRLARIISR